MSSNISNFVFDEYTIRILVEDGEPLFCAADVCLALGYGNPSAAIKKHTREEGITKRDTLTSKGIQSLIYIDEANLYRLVMRSKLESAERFQDWVYGEVLPAIRKTGRYAKPEIPPTYPEALIAYANELKARMALENQIKEDAPKVELADNFLNSDGDFYIRVVAKAIGIGAEKLFDWMRAHKMITKMNEPYADFCKRGYLRPRSSSFTRSAGTTQTTMSTRVTPKGIYYSRERLIKEGLLKPEHQINIDYLQQEIEFS